MTDHKHSIGLSSKMTTTTLIFSLTTILICLIRTTLIYASPISTENLDILQGSKPWLLKDYPRSENTDSCRTPIHDNVSLRSCDPDGVFSNNDWQEIDQALLNAPRAYVCGDDHDDSTKVEVQLAVAITRKLDLQSYRGYEDPHGRAASDFARGVHDAWGVGVPTRCGGTGVLLFLSDLDRSVYISRGDALKELLTDRRIDGVIENMKPFLQRQKYKEGILHALNEITYLIHYGKPQFYERITDLVARYSGLLWVGLIFAFCFAKDRYRRAQQRQYAQAAAQLDEIERARAQALQGQFKIESCPICLESFPREGEDQPTTGSDGLPLKLLRCGHCFDESCWAEWVNTGRGQIDKCPICQQSVGRSTVERFTETSPESEEIDQTTTNFSSQHDDTVEYVEEREMAPSTNRQMMQLDDAAQFRALQRYNRERNFRLARLATRYPRFITQQQVQRWSSSTYNGPLARDPTFVQNDPSTRNVAGQTENGSKTSSGASSSRPLRSSNFGGGSSGGGRGGRW